MSENLIHFYQTGTYTVGNRLLSPEERSGQAMMDRNNSLTSGHRACQGCGEALGARYAVDAAVRATGGNVAMCAGLGDFALVDEIAKSIEVTITPGYREGNRAWHSNGAPNGTRTRVAALKGRCPNR